MLGPKGLRRLLGIILSVMIIITLAGCGGNTPSTTAASTQQAATTAASTQQAATTAASTQQAATTAASTQQATADAAEVLKTLIANIPKNGKRYKLAFNNYNDTNVFCKQVHDSIKANCDKYGVDFLYAEASMDAQKVSANIDNFILQKADIIVEFNWMPEVAKTFVPKCAAAGIPVIAADARYDGAYYFGANNQVAGEKLGEFAAQKIKEKWNGQIDSIVLIYAASVGVELKKRMGGIIDGYRKVYPDFPDSKVIWFDNGGDFLKFKSITADYLTAHPDQKHILFAANNDEGGMSCLSAVQTANRESDCLIVSHGGDKPFQETVRKGNNGDIWIGSVAYAPERYGDYIVPYALNILAGNKVPMDVNPDHFVVTKDNIDQYYPISK